MVIESTQHKLDRVRPPRVQITYDVEVGDSLEKKELPFVMGIMGDYAGHADDQTNLKERKFVNIDRDNFNDVMKGMKPKLNMRVDNKLADDDSQLNVELEFEKMEDFTPGQLVKQVQPLRQLLEVRERLNDLRNKLYGNEKLESALQDVLENTEQLQALAKEAGVEDDDKASKKAKKDKEDK